jgi:hypothetical protein
MSLEARVAKLHTQLLPTGKIIVAHRYSCQTAPVWEAMAVETLGRALRPEDLLVIVDACDEPCPPEAHDHHHAMVIYPRH